MHHAQLTESVRRLIGEVFAQLRLGDGSAPREMLLIRDGVYCGRRFEVQGGHAIWSFEEDQLKLFRSDGSVLRVMERISANQPSMRKAA